MLERPILSPTEECEYFLIGTKEYKRGIVKIAVFYGLCGVNVGVAIATILFLLRSAR